MTAYDDALAANIRAARARLNISQEDVGQRMRWLGFGEWIRQTIGAIEHGRRSVRADETVGLAMALETTVVRLMTPVDITDVQFGETVLTPTEVSEAVVGGGDWPRQRPAFGQPGMDGDS